MRIIKKRLLLPALAVALLVTEVACAGGEQGKREPDTPNSIHVLWDTYCKETGFQSERLERVYWKKCRSREQIVLDFIGDVGFPEGKSTTRHHDVEQ